MPAVSEETPHRDDVDSLIERRVIAIADKYYKPGQFPTFVAYEWTLAPNNQNMHRNVFFRDSKRVPRPALYGARLKQTGRSLRLDGRSAQTRQ